MDGGYGNDAEHDWEGVEKALEHIHSFLNRWESLRRQCCYWKCPRMGIVDKAPTVGSIAGPTEEPVSPGGGGGEVNIVR